MNALPILTGEGGSVPARRYWQWNRYTPEIGSNAAARDGDWKLVRPPVGETFHTSPDEMAMDRKLNAEPWGAFEVVRGPIPVQQWPGPKPLALYNIAEDPAEQNDLAAREPQRVARMLRDLEAWFADVEADRASIGGPWAGMEAQRW